MPVRALIAEDEPLLAAELRQQLALQWPELQVQEVCADGLSAEREALRLAPDVLFFDIQMPGQSGLDAALGLADAWPDHHPGRPFPALVFVTAYDQYAVQAFEAQAVDYLLKPLQFDRLEKSIKKIKNSVHEKRVTAPDFDNLLNQLSSINLSKSEIIVDYLRILQVSVGTQIRMVPTDEVLLLEAADKYLQVVTEGHEYLLRTPLKDLLPQLNPHDFWQVHRGTAVRASAIDTVHRDDTGRLSLSLRGLHRRVPVSRVWAHRFKAL
jgi:DNA-binding LytR/AlgR family response regulator